MPGGFLCRGPFCCYERQIPLLVSLGKLMTLVSKLSAYLCLHPQNVLFLQVMLQAGFSFSYT
jgi:hypothetical protein